MNFVFLNIINFVLSGLKFTSHWFTHCFISFNLEEAGSPNCNIQTSVISK